MVSRLASLLLDPSRRSQQLAYVADRTPLLHVRGQNAWVRITEAQATTFGEQGIAVRFTPAADQILLPLVAFEPLELAPGVPAALQTPTSAAVASYTLVQSLVPLQRDQINRLVALGAAFVQTLDTQLAVFRCTPSVAESLRALPDVRWVGVYHRAYALSYELLGASGPLAAGAVAATSSAAVTLAPAPVGNLVIRFFADVTDVEAKTPAVAATGARVVHVADAGLVVEATRSQIDALLAIEGVYSLERHVEQTTDLDRSARIVFRDELSQPGMGGFSVSLDGAGETVGVIDTGLDTGVLATMHRDMRGRVIAALNRAPGGGALPPDVDGHGTHTSGTCVGNGTESDGRIKGLAPAASLYFQGPLPATRADLIRAHFEGARCHNNSYGPANTSIYDANATDTDRVAYACGDSLFMFTTGNAEADANGDGDLDLTSMRPTACAKNVVGVGATETVRDNDGVNTSYRDAFSAVDWAHANFDPLAGPGNHPISDNADQVVLFSGRGFVLLPAVGAAAPVSTNRVKPDLVAPGSNIIATKSSASVTTGSKRPSTVSADHYAVYSGTSMACPHVTGASALVRQFYRTQFSKLARPISVDKVSTQATPPPDFIDRPALVDYPDGVLMVWVKPAAAGAAKQLLVHAHDRSLQSLRTQSFELFANVGDHPAPQLARDGAHVFLIRRSASELLLSRYALNAGAGSPINLDAGFDADGTLTVTSSCDMDPARPPSVAVHGAHVAVAWSNSGDGSLHLRRYQTASGAAVDAADRVLGAVSKTSQHVYLVHTDNDPINEWAALWIARVGSADRVQFRRIAEDGTVQGAEPLLVAESGEIESAHISWDNRTKRYVVVYQGADAGGRALRFVTITAAGALEANETTSFNVPADKTLRRVFVALHPSSGYMLGWEDDSFRSHFDVYVGFVNDGGAADGRVPVDPQVPGRRQVMRVSDSPQSTSGVALLADASGLVVLWQSQDEINSDSLDIVAVGITPQGAFASQDDPHTPLIQQGRYELHQLHEHGNPSLPSVDMVWADGGYYLTRSHQAADTFALPEMALLRTNADGLPDDGYGVGGVRVLASGPIFSNVTLRWLDDVLVAVSYGGLSDVIIHAFDSSGAPLAAPGAVFGVAGVVRINDLGSSNVAAQVDRVPGAAPFQLVVARGTGFPFTSQIEYLFFDHLGARFQPPGSPAPPAVLALSGPSPIGHLATARHGWFQTVSDGGQIVAIWERREGVNGAGDLFFQRFPIGGPPAAPAPLHPARPVGSTRSSRNGTIALRPVGVQAVATQREYALVWQHRDSDVDPWEIQFRRVNRAGALQPIVRVIHPGLLAAGGGALWPPVAGTPLQAIEPQIVCNFVYEPHGPTPAVGTALAALWGSWSPGYGLAWLGEAATGKRTLYFTALDETGARIETIDPPGARVRVGITQLSDGQSDVKAFKLIWNGRSYRLTWTEERNGKLRHMQTALTRQGSQQVYSLPSGALLRATLVNGATNIDRTALPNVPRAPITAANRNHGYGWGRINLRQSLTPSPPVTFHVRDDGSVGPGGTASYRFNLPPQTKLLRVTLLWNDPPTSARVVNNLSLRVRAPDGGSYHGNTWDAANPWRSRNLTGVAPLPAFHDVENTEQVVLADPPAGDYEVDVLALVAFGANDFCQFAGQPFALIFVGSGEEIRFSRVEPC